MIPQSLYDQPAMLADQSKNIAPLVDDALDALLADSRVWFFDLKYDGIRCLAYIDAGNVKLINRNRVDITYRYPDLVEALLKAYPKRSLVLDGEVIVLKEGLPHFASAHKRDAQMDTAKITPALIAAYPATYMVFDLLFADGDDMRALPYQVRRGLLKSESATLAAKTDSVVQWSRSEREGDAMWKVVRSLDMEGLIAKAGNAPYRAGRGPTWVKLKPTKTLSALVGGYDPGKGARSSTFGNLHLFLVHDGALISCGKVGSGFTEADLQEILPMLTHPGVDPMIVEVEYQMVSADGQLRFPVFKGLRSDLTLADCDAVQLKQ